MVLSVLLPLWYRRPTTPIVSSVLLPWYRQSYYPYGIVSVIIHMVLSVLLPWLIRLTIPW
jgi:hypothetical protein